MFEVSAADIEGLAFWAYAVILLLAASDAVLPVLPSETVVILGAVLAAQGHLDPWGVLGAAAIGAIAGDWASYGLGRTAMRRGPTFTIGQGRIGKALRFACRHLQRRGRTIIVTARFIPGGRTATTFASGYLRYSRRAFMVATVIGGLAWAAYGTAIGYIGGRVFEEAAWKALLAGLGMALTVAVVVEAIRSAVRRRRPAAPDPPVAEAEVELQRT